MARADTKNSLLPENFSKTFSKTLDKRAMRSYNKARGYDLERVIVAPPAYDEKKMRGYYIEQSQDGTGYTFKVLDASLDSVFFEVTWIKNEGLPAWEYEGAISFWLT